MENKKIISRLSETIKTSTDIPKALFEKMGVKRGLRNEDHTGVLAGLTRVGDVVGYERNEDGTLKPIDGQLYYRGINVADLVTGIQKEKRLGFEETAFLLLSGTLPNKEELELFRKYIMHTMPLEHNATMNIFSLQGKNIMNILA
ncbi:MAG: citrate/2-methylcitrate synthase, partial [Dysgonamonadaceae bacterium]|nr:citrate/2-methylcitrate synthase [Dysgonamonadaceae bacterium]